jgi:hypothetical protein
MKRMKVTKAGFKRFFEKALNEGKALTLTKEVEQTYLVLDTDNVETWNEFEMESRQVKKIQTNAIVFYSDRSPQGSYLYMDSEEFNPIEVSENRVITQRQRLVNRTMIHHNGVNYDEFPVKEVIRLIYTIS